MDWLIGVYANYPLLVWLALYEDGLESRIDAGENKGLVLHHDRVVRALVGPWRMDAARWRPCRFSPRIWRLKQKPQGSTRRRRK